MPAGTVTTPLDRRLRAARDRLLDLTLLGETAPLQDLPASVEPPIVTFGGTANALVKESQVGVVYELRDKDGAPRLGEGGRPLDAPIEGTGGPLAFPLEAVQAEASFTVQARKLPGPGPVPLSGRSAVLHARPSVKVGLATGLTAFIRPGPTETPPVIDHGTVVEVEIQGSQEGVDYRLVHHPAGEPADPTDLATLDRETVVSAAPWTRGNGATIVLRSVPLTADILLRVRSLKEFEEGRRETQLLARRLPARVRPDRARRPELLPAGPVAHGGAPVLRLDSAEPSVAYRLHLRRLREAEFRPGATGEGLLRIPVEGAPDVVVEAPDPPTDWPEPAGYTAHGGHSATTGGRIELQLPPLTDDTLVLVEARKSHDPAVAGAPDARSTAALADTPVLLVRPDPQRPLRLSVAVAQDRGSTGPITVEGGEPGVAYAFRVAPDGPDLPLAAYVHRRDETDPGLNKGLGQLWLGIDLVVATDLPGPASGLPASAQPPPAPHLEAPDLPFGTKLAIRAVKARTGVSAPLAATVPLGAPPRIDLLTQPLPPGAVARVAVRASRPAETYALEAGGRVTPAVPGTGADLELASPPLGRDGRLIVRITATGAPIHVELRYPMAVPPPPPVRRPDEAPPTRPNLPPPEDR